MKGVENSFSERWNFRSQACNFKDMRKTIVLYGLSLAVLIILLKVLEYRFFVRDLSLEFYLGLIAILCTAFGVWAGLRLTRPKKVLVPVSATQFKLNEA